MKAFEIVFGILLIIISLLIMILPLFKRKTSKGLTAVTGIANLNTNRVYGGASFKDKAINRIVAISLSISAVLLLAEMIIQTHLK